jgi:hypothetical protein
MPSIANSAEGGADGVTVTSANSGGASGNAVTTANIGAGNSITFATTAKDHGLLGFSFNYGITNPSYLTWNIATTQRTVFRFYLNVPDLPSATEWLATFVNSNSTNMCSLVINSTGNLQVLSSANNPVSGSNAPSTFPINQWVRIEFAVTKGSTTGRYEYSYYLGDSTSPVYTYDSTASHNAGAYDCAAVSLGRQSTGTQSRIIAFDDIAAQDISSGWLGPYTIEGITLGSLDETRVSYYTKTVGANNLDTDSLYHKFLQIKTSRTDLDTDSMEKIYWCGLAGDNTLSVSDAQSKIFNPYQNEELYYLRAQP